MACQLAGGQAGCHLAHVMHAHEATPMHALDRTWSLTPPSKKILLPCFIAKKLRPKACGGRGRVSR